MDGCITTSKQNKLNHCAYFMEYRVWLENSNSDPLHSKIGLNEYVIRLWSNFWCVTIYSKISKCLRCCSMGVQKVIIWPSLIEHGGNFAWLRSATFQPLVDLNIASPGRTQTACHSTARGLLYTLPLYWLSGMLRRIYWNGKLNSYRDRHMYTNTSIHPSIHPSTIMLNALWIVLPSVYPTATNYRLIYQYSRFVKSNKRNSMPYQHNYSL